MHAGEVWGLAKGAKGWQVEATKALVQSLLVKDGPAAVDLASATACVCHDAGDLQGEAASRISGI